MRLFLVITALLVGSIWFAFAYSVRPRPSGESRQSIATEGLAAKLDRPVTWPARELLVGELPLFLANQLQMPVYIPRTDSRDLQEVRQLRVKLEFTDVPLRVALTTVLRQHDLAYIVDDDHLLIMPSEDADQWMVERVYPVNDLLARASEYGSSDSYYELEEALEAIEPESWQMGGTGDGTIATFPGVLIVRQSPRVHDKIAELLRQLRQSPRPKSSPRSQPILPAGGSPFGRPQRPYVGSPIPVVG